MKARTTGLASLIGLIVAASTLFLTCEVGLGDSVDVKAPSVTIVSPSADSVIRGTFTVTGSAADDTSLGSVSVSLSETSSGAAYGPYGATLDSAHTAWSISLNGKNADGSYAIADGTYQITATAVDTSSRSSVAQTVYQIDNSNPTVLVTSPLTYGADNLVTFFKTIDIKGEVYDASSLSRVDVSVLSAAGTVIKTITADGTATWSARFDSDVTSALLADGTTYYYKVVATDAAGNQNEYYFHRSDIYPELDKSSGYVIFPSMNQIGKLDQGLLSKTDQGLSPAILKTLRHWASWTSPVTQQYCDFSYEDTESPKVDWLNIDGGTTTLGLDVPIVGTIRPPSDGSAITRSSVVFTIKDSTVAGDAGTVQSSVTLTAVGSSLNFEVQPKDSSGVNLTSGNYTISVAFGTGSGISGGDEESFGISSGAPVLTETGVGGSTSPAYYIKNINAAATMSGKAESGDTTPVAVGLGYSYYKDSDSASPTSGSVTVNSSTHEYTFGVPVSDEGTFTYTLTATSGGLSTKITRVFVVDTTSPTIGFKNPTEGSSADSTKSGSAYIIAISGTADDGAGSGISKVYFKPGADDVTTDYSSALPAVYTAWTPASGTIINWSGSLSVSSEGSKRLWVCAVDNAGNAKLSSVNFTLDLTAPVADFSDSTVFGQVDGVDATKTSFTLGGLANDDALDTADSTVVAASSAVLSWTRDGSASGSSVLTPTADGKWSWTSPASMVSGSADGLYVFTLTVTDIASKKTVATKTVRIDASTPTLTITAPLANSSVSVGDYTAEGTVYDLGVGLASADAVTYVLTGEASTVTGSAVVTDSTWKAEHLSLKTQGLHGLTVEAIDKLGNKVSSGTNLFYFDTEPPTLSETALATSETVYKTKGYSLSGTAADSNALKSLVITELKEGGSVTQLYAKTDFALSKSFDYSIATSSTASDGKYDYTLTVTDVAGRTASLTRTVKIDSTAPTLSADVTVSGSSSSSAGVSYYSGTVTFSGTSTDGTDSGASGIASVQYSLDNSAWTNAVGTTDWSLTKDLSAQAEGSYPIYFRAIDKSGLISATVGLVIQIDHSAPRATETIHSSSLIKSNADVSFSGLADDSAFTAGYTFRAASSATLAYSKDGAASVTAAKGTDAGKFDWKADGSWNWILPSSWGDGLYTMTLTVVDAAGKESSVSRSVKIDTAAPTVTVSSPGSGASVDTSSIAIAGTADDGSGVGFDGNLDAEYRLGSGSWTTLGSLVSTINWSVPGVSLGSEGAKTLSVRATDSLGNVSAEKTVSFFYDLAAPVVGETTVGTTDTKYLKDASAVKFGGTWTETDSLTSIVTSYKKDGGDSEIADTYVPSTSAGTGMAWTSAAITLPSDGTYVFTITATDIAGKTASLTRTIVLDTVKPTAVLTTGLAGWHTTQSIKIEGTAADTSGTANSGVSKAQYSLNGTDFYDLTGTTSWAGTITVPEGDSNKLYVRSIDQAGNESLVSDPVFVTVDSIAPDFDITSPTTTPVVNGKSPLDFTITATDATSGPAGVTASLSATSWATIATSASFSSGNATITIPANKLPSAEGNKKIYFKVTDAAGNETVAVGSAITIDKTAPTGSVTSHSDGATVNKKITLSGTASDSYLSASPGSFAVWKPASPGASDAATAGSWEAVTGVTVSGTTSWSVADFNTASYSSSSYDAGSAAGFQLLVGYLASDTAGNTAYITRTLTVDQDADKPVITLNNLDVNTTSVDSDDGLKYAVLKSTKTIYGTISDDDGSISTIKIANSAPSDWSAVSSLDVASGSFAYTVTGGDGKKQLYIQVTDAAGTPFTTTASATDLSPRVALTAGYLQTPVLFKLGTNPPVVATSDIKYDSTTTTAFDDPVTLGSSTAFGSDVSGKFLVQIETSSSNAISSVNVSVTDSAATPKSSTKAASLAAAATPVNAGYKVYRTTDAFDIRSSAGFTDGTATLSITVTDELGLSTTVSRTISIDNTAPSIAVTSHAANEQVTGDVILKGTSDDGTGSGVKTVSYHVGKCADAAALAAATFNDLSTSLAWSISFTSSGAGVITTTATYANSTYATETTTGSNVWILPVYIRSTDSAGNVKTKEFDLNVDPDGDKPTVSVLYPASGTTLGGTIRIFGSAEDNVSVASVWMEIDTDNNSVYDSADMNSLVAKGYGATAAAIANGFKVSGTASWSQAINSSGEFNSSSGTGTNTIQFRVCALDDKGTQGTWSAWHSIIVDNNAPKIGSTTPLKLVQYSDSNLSVVSAEQAYVSDMYIRGQWYLVGSVEDESGITAIKVSGSATGNLASAPSWFVKGAAVGSNYDYTLKIPVGVALSDTSSGSQTYTIYVEDGSSPQGNTTQTVSINYDNKAPEVTAPTHGGLTISASTPIVQSNNTYTIGSSVTESGSGFNRMVFFFVRRSSSAPTDLTKARLYNPMVAIDAAETASDVAGNRTYLSNLTWDTGDVPRLDVTGATRSGEDSFTLSSIATNYNIRVGGLVRIAGVDRVIKTVNRTTGTITFSPSVSTSYTSASFLYGQVIDNTVVETGNWSGSTLTSITNDDGDGMVESVTKSGGTYTMDASINSKYIPDGPVQLYYVAYDKAGNSVSGYVTSTVANSGPKIAKVYLGNDLSGDGKFSGSELSTVYTASSGSEPSTVNIADKTYIMKGDLAVIPEFVGGNGALYYVWSANASGTTAWAGSTYRTDPETSASPQTLSAIPYYSTSSTPANGFIVSASDTGVTAMDDCLKLFSFTVWDSTDETTPGADSQWDIINVPVNVNVVDNVPPSATISPLYWNGAADNSLYGNSRANGHIELTSYKGGMGPDVSGQISIRGTARDDQRLSELWMSITDYTGSSTPIVQRFGFSTGTTSKAAFGIKADGTNSTLSDTYFRVAYYDTTTGAWVGTDAMTADGWKFTVTSDTLTQSGHTIEWEMDWDSSKVADVAALNNYVRIIAEDKRSTVPNASAESSASTASGALTPCYGIDVVPYITGITRNVTTYRSKYGVYPVTSAETGMTLTGFNLPGTASGAVKTQTTANKATTTYASTITASGATGSSSMAFTAPASSCYIAVVTNGIQSENNLNSNDAKGSYTGTDALHYYNRDYSSDTSGSDNWTDDRYLYVWDINHYFKGSIDGMHAPSMSSDTDGNLYATWASFGNPSIQFEKGLTSSNVRIFGCYDQPAAPNDISVDKKSGTTTASVLFFPDHEGSGGTPDWWGMANGQRIGGAYALTVTDLDDVKNTGKHTGFATNANPYLIFDGDNRSAAYQLASYDMKRDLGLFSTPRTVKYGSAIHSVWYDSSTQSLKYSYVNATSTEAQEHNDGTVVGWVTIDGNNDGQDRIHSYTAGSYRTYDNSDATRETISVSAGQSVIASGNNAVSLLQMSTANSAYSNNTTNERTIVAYKDNLLGVDGTANSTTSVSFNATSAAYWSSKIVAGATIGLMYQSVATGEYKIVLRTITGTPTWSSSTVTVSLDSAFITGVSDITASDSKNSKGLTVSVYTGNFNVVGKSASLVETVSLGSNAAKSSSAGKYSSMDVTSAGYPVVMYYDAANEILRVAYASSVSPKLASNWTRTNVVCGSSSTKVSGGTHVAMKIDSTGYIHAIYRGSDGYLYYIKSTTTSGYGIFTTPVCIDTSGALTYGTLSLINNTTPCVTYLNSEDTSSGIKYALQTTIDGITVWDSQIVPVVSGHYVTGDNRIYVEANGGSWSATEDTVDTSKCLAAIGFQSDRFDVVFLKKE